MKYTILALTLVCGLAHAGAAQIAHQQAQQLQQQQIYLAQPKPQLVCMWQNQNYLDAYNLYRLVSIHVKNTNDPKLPPRWVTTLNFGHYGMGGYTELGHKPDQGKDYFYKQIQERLQECLR